MRIALIHALRQSPPPIEAAFARYWPEATLRNIMDDSLSADLVRDGALTAAMTYRFLKLARYAADSGADAILFTCSAFGPCIAAVRDALAPLPVRTPSEAMIAEAAAAQGRVGLIATFAPTLESMPAEFPAGVELELRLADGALAALDAGDADLHDRRIVEAAATMDGCATLALAQFSMSRAAPLVEQATGKRVLTTPDAAVRELRRTLEG